MLRAMGIAFLVGGAAAMFYGRSAGAAALGLYLMGGSFVVTGAVLLVVGVTMSGRSKRAAQLRATGRKAWARVESVQDTGVTVNNNPQIKIKLRVQPYGEPEFEVVKRMTVSRLSVPQPGTTVAVAYDPDDHESIVFDDSSPDTPAPAVNVAGATGTADASELEPILRQKLTEAGVTGERQDEAVRKALAAASSGAGVVDLREFTRGPGYDAGDDKLDQLKKLQELRDAGTLTPAEFDAAKAKLLAEL